MNPLTRIPVVCHEPAAVPSRASLLVALAALRAARPPAGGFADMTPRCPEDEAARDGARRARAQIDAAIAELERAVA